jgi:hypothetical protein
MTTGRVPWVVRSRVAGCRLRVTGVLVHNHLDLCEARFLQAKFGIVDGVES